MAPVKMKFRLQYRLCGVWVNGNTFPTKKAAADYGVIACRQRPSLDGYQVVKLK